MTVRDVNAEALRHGKITEEPLRDKPRIPSWALKLAMAITGLIFGGFVLVHMAGNLKVFNGDGGAGEADIDVYGEFLRTVGEPLLPREGLLWIARLVLLASLVIHIYGAIALRGRSRHSRGKFKRTNLMGGHHSFAARTMMVTGVVLLLFIIFHILDLTLGVPPAATDVFEHGEVYANMIASFSRWPVTIFYVLSMLVLFLHLSHGIWLAVSDLGITGKRWRAVLSVVAYLVPAVVMVGNILMPLAIATGLLD
ncbi:succinate dehydrogenase cytochrome b subunit [Corynebacterium otitidis]|uniref:B558 family succinate dehydrogenase (Or fumarate reductase) cytochrome B subunit n=1 Tax=Corynebacterium otitidis ATCC 51513 TaxID=883169 RepID=I7LCM1_9CORY|nr:succinate dehydrogenase cytochrome b subunit [Corynebacterium otitidis]EJZ81458.1 b558 family succinate dehydrogenase (or fumarate reductase) cytochrome B subunit [Corynebacterium otitidis ATCC 51513]CCI84074.1 succinate dehydrogenase subunit [Corynebacterium otitidis ATCC 51513]